MVLLHVLLLRAHLKFPIGMTQWCDAVVGPWRHACARFYASRIAKPYTSFMAFTAAHNTVFWSRLIGSCLELWK